MSAVDILQLVLLLALGGWAATVQVRLRQLRNRLLGHDYHHEVRLDPFLPVGGAAVVIIHHKEE